jgi:Tfp pilus assembly protein PilO
MTKLRQWSVATAVVVVAVLAGGWFLLVSPQRSHASQLRKQAASVESSNATLQTQVDELRAQERNLPAQQAWLAQFAERIPNNPGLPALIRQLSSAADSAGVDLNSLSPGPPALVSQTQSSGAVTLPTSSSLAQISVAITANGPYFNLEQFFANLESLRRVLIVDSFSVAPAGSTSSAGSDSASISARVFMTPPAQQAAGTHLTTPAKK